MPEPDGSGGTVKTDTVENSSQLADDDTMRKECAHDLTLCGTHRNYLMALQ